MPVIPLPDEPSFEQLRKQAKDLRRAVLAGDPGARAEIAERVPDATGEVRLRTAQLVVARRYGFASWARLKRHVEVIEQYSRFPDRVGDDGAPADTFLRLACLAYADDEPERWAQARRLLAEHPEITADSVHAAAAAADTAALLRFLDADPAATRLEGGPFRWEPLVYLAYARHDPAIEADSVLTAARLLLGAGADPNAGYLWHGLPSPFTVLTGVFGEGELGPVRQPRHPHSLALARLLLEAGADPNDGQALYNRMFEPGNDHLELLIEFGLGRGDGGPWRQRLGAALDTPTDMVRGDLAWAITHDMTERVRLLVTLPSIDLTTPWGQGEEPSREVAWTAMAATTGHLDLVDFLVAQGAPPLDLQPADALVAAALAADRDWVDGLLAGHPGLLGELRTARPALVTWAAACGAIPAVELLVQLGF